MSEQGRHVAHTGARIFIIHPDHTMRLQFLWDLIADSQVAYLRFNGEKLDLNALQEQLQTVYPEAEHDPLTSIVLDECDRAEKSALQDFLRQLLQEQESLKIFVLTRSLYHFTREWDIDRSLIRMIPDDEGLMLPGLFLDIDEIRLTVRAFGNGHAYVNGIEVTEWGGLLNQQLFFFMIDNPIMTRNLIFNTFWPGLDVQAATNVFHVTKRNVSKALGFELVKYAGGYYRLAPNVKLDYDVAKFHEMIQRGVTEMDIPLLQKAIHLFRNNFLHGMEMVWVEGRREELLLSFSESLSAVGAVLLEAGQIDSALGIYIKASAAHMGREDVAEQIMHIYIQKDMPCDAVHVFERTRQYLKATVRMNPQQSLVQLAHEANTRCIDSIGSVPG